MDNFTYASDTLRPATSLELSQVSRTLFESTLRSQDAARQQQELIENRQLLDQILPTLSKEYAWLTSVDTQKEGVMVEAFTAIRQYQRDAMTEKGECPTGRATYIEFRKRIETADEVGDVPLMTVQLIEAMMDGNIRDGELPNFNETVRQ